MLFAVIRLYIYIYIYLCYMGGFGYNDESIENRKKIIIIYECMIWYPEDYIRVTEVFCSFTTKRVLIFALFSKKNISYIIISRNFIYFKTKT